ncbi:MAG TPA: hypothetical protein VHL52_07345 [Acidimicrobiia bacterium]|nr:hypothetical protein [Acidimicrobiia bacterium]
MLTSKEATAWVAGRVPDDWFIEAPEVRVDRDEILVIGRLAPPELSGNDDAGDQAVADRSRIEAWREETRQARVRIAQQAEANLDRTISWGARCGEQGFIFTSLSVPVMTRLRMKQRQVLDTLIDAGVARSRSEALAWCVKIVADKQEDWLADLRDAIEKVHDVRRQGPAA